MTVAPFHFDRTTRVTVVSASMLPGVLVNPAAFPSGGAFTPPQLRVIFDVDRSISKDPSRAKVRVINLSKTSRERMAGIVRRKIDFSREFAFIDGRLIEGAALGGGVAEVVETAAGFGYIKLEAGYDGVASTIFEGGTNRVESEHVGTEWITEVVAGDGELSIQKAIANKTFAAGTPIVAIIAYLIRTMGLFPAGLATPPPVLAATTATTSIVCAGRARDILDELLRGVGLEWFVDSGEVWLLEPNGTIPVPPVPIALAYDRPKKLENGTVEIRTPLERLARPGAPAAVALQSLQGTYRINRARFVGDNRGGRYDTTLELQDLSPIAGL